MNLNTKVLEIWGKYLVFSLITAIGVIGKSPLDFSTHDWKQCINAIWISLVPVIVKWANPKDDLTMTKQKA